MRNVGRIDHVVGVVRPENFEAAVSKMASAFNTSFCTPYERRDAGVLVVVSWETGIELITPLPTEEGKFLAGILEAKGEHWISMVFGVGDIERTCEQMRQLGQEPLARYDGLSGDEPWFEQFSVVKEASFDSSAFGGLPMVFSMIEEKNAQK